MKGIKEIMVAGILVFASTAGMAADVPDSDPTTKATPVVAPGSVPEQPSSNDALTAPNVTEEKTDTKSKKKTRKFGDISISCTVSSDNAAPSSDSPNPADNSTVNGSKKGGDAAADPKSSTDNSATMPQPAITGTEWKKVVKAAMKKCQGACSFTCTVTKN